MSDKEHPQKGGGENKRGNLFRVTEAEELMKFLLAKMPHKNRNNIKTLLRDKQVLVDGKPVSQFNHALNPGQEVEITNIKVAEEKQYHGISIIYEDQHLIVIDKHAGLLSISTPNEKNQTAYSLLSSHVKRQNAASKIFVVHRLDRETSGLMMFAKSEKVKNLLQESWHKLVTERSYLAVIEGVLDPPEGTVTSYLWESKALIVYSSQDPTKGDKAVTHYQTMKTAKGYSLLKVSLETGRKNQVRVHMKDLGHPVIGDKKYGSEVDPIARLGLHAWVLAFTHPVTQESLRFETQMPRRFLRLF